MLKIGFCINSLEMGGAERLLVDIINALYETKDYEIHLLTKIKSNSYFYNLIKNKVKYSFLLEKKAKGFFAKTRESILKKINFKKFSNEVDIIIDFLDGDFFSYIRKVKDKEKASIKVFTSFCSSANLQTVKKYFCCKLKSNLKSSFNFLSIS